MLNNQSEVCSRWPGFIFYKSVDKFFRLEIVFEMEPQAFACENNSPNKRRLISQGILSTPEEKRI